MKIPKENEEKLINGIKKLKKQIKVVGNEKDLIKVMKEKFTEFEMKRT